MSTEDSEREPGLYWIMDRGVWSVGQWIRKSDIPYTYSWYWIVLGTDEMLPTRYLDRIGAPIQIPEKYRD